MDGARRFQSSDMPLLSRLDHLDFTIKRLEGKQNLSGWGGNNLVRGAEGQSQPLDTAVKEAYFKGTLLDRVASLEKRLFQLYLELESSSTSGNSSSQTSGYASSSQGSKSEPFCSLPIFNNQHQGLKEVSVVHATKTEIQETSRQEVEVRNNSNAVNKKIEKRVDREDKICKKGKKNPRKKMPPKWPHLKILGC